MPAQLLWTNGMGTGLWATAANWTDTLGGPSVVPGPGDYVYFGSGGSNTACTMNLVNETVDRIIMDANYTATLSILPGNRLATANHFIQYGGLSMNGTVSAGTFLDINGSVTHVMPIAGTLAASGSFFLRAGASITDTSGPTSFGLVLSSAGFDDGGTISAGGFMSGSITINGPFVEQPAASINVGNMSTLKFLSAGNPGAFPVLQGSVNLGALGAATATISTDTVLSVSGTLTSLGGPHTIVGDVGILNGGAMNVGATLMPSTLNMSTGSLTVGARNSSLPSSSGTLNVSQASVLNFPVVPGITSTFVVMASVLPTSGGVINMFGGTLSLPAARVAGLALNGALMSFGVTLGPPTPDLITGNLNNAGTIQFLGTALHSLNISGSYTQAPTADLEIRLNNGDLSDRVNVGGTATLGGALGLTPLTSLTPAQLWTIMTAGLIVGNFGSITPGFVGTPLATLYTVAN